MAETGDRHEASGGGQLDGAEASALLLLCDA